MDLVNRHRGIEVPRPFGHPFLIVPNEAADVIEAAGRLGPVFGIEGEGVGLVDVFALGVFEMVFIGLVFVEPAHEAFVDAGVVDHRQHFGAHVPAVPFANDRDVAGKGGIEAEIDAVDHPPVEFLLAIMRAEILKGVDALAHQVVIQ